MRNLIHTSVKNANLVDCENKQHISSQPTILTKENFLGEFRTDLDKKKVLANLGIISDVLLEWEFIKGDIGKNSTLMNELNSRTKYISQIDGLQKNLSDGLNYLENIIGGEDTRLTTVEQLIDTLNTSFNELKNYLIDDIDISVLKETVDTISQQVQNITTLIQVSTKIDNALTLLSGENPGLYVPDLSKSVSDLENQMKSILESYVTKDDLGGDDFNFATQEQVTQISNRVTNINNELQSTVKTDQTGHVLDLKTKSISNNFGPIDVSNSFNMTNASPLDVRFVVQSISDLHSLNPKVCYAGMGVIVADQASLYILRKPQSGTITKEYIQDEKGQNWKCPEDLVIEALSQDEYNKKIEDETINPNMFYYIYEDQTSEPDRSDYDSDEAYNEAYDKWLRVLQQQYMSAVWGTDIERQLALKASNDQVISIINLIGSNSDVNSESKITIFGLINKLVQTISTLENRIEELESKISE